MYIEPETKVYLLSGVPLDDTYEHTIYFDSENDQEKYFINNGSTLNPSEFFVKYLSAQSYQDPADNVIRCEVYYKDIINCNYMCFKNGHIVSNANPNHELNLQKWFYCFIKKIRYINNNVTEIEYEVDVMQTYMFDYELKECFIDREHTGDDGIYNNTVPEDLNLGTEYYCYNDTVLDMNPQTEPLPFPNGYGMKICILVNAKPAGTSGPTLAHDVINEVYTGCRAYYGYWVHDYLNIPPVLNSYLPEDIIAIYQYPSIFGDNPNINATRAISRAGREFGNKTAIYEATQPLPTFLGYKPDYLAKNNKMACYPYTKLQVSDNAGNVSDYKYEMFRNTNKNGDSNNYVDNVYFMVSGVALTDPAILLYPIEYCNIPNAYDEGVLMSNFPTCCWPGDVYRTWWAENKNQFQTSLLTSTIGAFLSGGSSAVQSAAHGSYVGGPAGGAVGALAGVTNGVFNVYSTIANQMAKLEDIRNRPNSTYGSAQTSSLNAFNNRYRFDCYEMKIKLEYAIMIDQYFSRYGYKTNKIKKPNRKARNFWTYTKTVGCAITETIANDIAEKICSIYDKGITFWNYNGTYTIGKVSEEHAAVKHLGEYSYFKRGNPNPTDPVDTWGFYNPTLPTNEQA